MDPTLLLVSGFGDAEGARGAAGALACAASTPDQATLLVDLGGRQPPPTLVSSPAATALETATAGLFPDHAPAARGQLCHLALAPKGDRLTALGLVAATRLQVSHLIVHLSYELVLPVLREGVLHPDGVLLRADRHSDRKMAAKAVRDLIRAEVPLAVLDHRLNWVAERRALFGVLPADAPGGLPGQIVTRLLPDSDG